ncbi:hypothetical protein ACJJTC_014869, partial [Scirpophaga incertulas]
CWLRQRPSVRKSGKGPWAAPAAARGARAATSPPWPAATTRSTSSAAPRTTSTRSSRSSATDRKAETVNGVPEWAIVELQGLVQLKDGATGPTVVGDLHYFKRNRHPVLILGHHVLNGKEVKLEQPMAVIEKVIDDGKTKYNLKAIVKKKLLFKSRPKPIISNVADKV